jgi:hypothetical protein
MSKNINKVITNSQSQKIEMWRNVSRTATTYLVLLSRYIELMTFTYIKINATLHLKTSHFYTFVIY